MHAMSSYCNSLLGTALIFHFLAAGPCSGILKVALFSPALRSTESKKIVLGKWPCATWSCLLAVGCETKSLCIGDLNSALSGAKNLGKMGWHTSVYLAFPRGWLASKCISISDKLFCWMTAIQIPLSSFILQSHVLQRFSLT